MNNKNYKDILHTLRTTEPSEPDETSELTTVSDLIDSIESGLDSVTPDTIEEKHIPPAEEKEADSMSVDSVTLLNDKPAPKAVTSSRFSRKSIASAFSEELMAESDDLDDIDFEDAPQHKQKRSVSGMILGNPILTFILLGVLCLMCGAVTFLAPSAATIIQSETVVEQRNASVDIHTGVSLITTNIVNEVQGMPKLFLLPVTDTPGSPYSTENSYTYTDESGIKHNVYEDPSITVDVWKQKGKIKNRSYVASYAKVKIAHPTQLRTSVSSSGYRNRSRVSVQAKKKNAIIAVNGDFYTLRKTGIIIRQGTYYQKKKSAREALFIDSDGNFHFMSSTKALKTGFLDETTIYNSLNFGPVLVRDGELCHYKSASKNNLASMHFGRNPRTGIGQLGTLEYLVIVVDGRTKESGGLTTNDFAKLFHEAGCINAYNLDGGQSSCMAYMGNVYNTVSNAGERLVSDIVYFASAMPDKSEIY